MHFKRNRRCINEMKTLETFNKLRDKNFIHAEKNEEVQHEAINEIRFNFFNFDEHDMI